jgi:hypothetical protein
MLMTATVMVTACAIRVTAGQTTRTSVNKWAAHLFCGKAAPGAGLSAVDYVAAGPNLS